MVLFKEDIGIVFICSAPLPSSFVKSLHLSPSYAVLIGLLPESLPAPSVSLYNLTWTKPSRCSLEMDDTGAEVGCSQSL